MPHDLDFMVIVMRMHLRILSREAMPLDLCLRTMLSNTVAISHIRLFKFKFIKIK